MACVAPYATLPPGVLEYIGPVQGSSPDFSSSAFIDRGRRHAPPPQSQLSTQGFQGWYSNTPEPAQKTITRHVPQQPSTCYAEPIVQGAHSSYFSRRALSSSDHPEESQGYRRIRRAVPPVAHVDRAVGKMFIAEPQGAPPRLAASRPQQYKLSEHAPEPSMPRLARPFGATILRESETELSYDRAMGQKIRVGMDTYRGAGRAGDLSISSAPSKRPEDTPGFFISTKDSPTFTRFVASLPPKAAVGPHQRRALQAQRAQQSERQNQSQLVASLQMPDGDD